MAFADKRGVFVDRKSAKTERCELPLKNARGEGCDHCSEGRPKFSAWSVLGGESPAGSIKGGGQEPLAAPIHLPFRDDTGSTDALPPSRESNWRSPSVYR